MVLFRTHDESLLIMTTQVPTTENSALAPTLGYTKAGEFQPDLYRPFVVKDLLNPGEVGMIAGAPGLGKTTIMAAIAAHAAQGRNLGKCEVRNTVVIYYAAEDSYGVLCRAYPYMGDPACANAPFYVIHRGENLADPKSVERITAFTRNRMAEHKADQALVVFDTLNRCIGDADENSSSAMATVVANANHIAREVNASVVLIHHVGTGSQDRPRGSSAFHSNLDMLCLLQASDSATASKVVFLKPKKKKNSENMSPIPFQLTSFLVGKDQEGDKVTVPMAVPMAGKSFSQAQPTANTNAKLSPKNDPRCADIERVLNELETGAPGKFHAAPDIGSRSGAIFNAIRDNADSLRKAVRRSLDALEKSGKIERNQTGYRILK
jgi:hypothetical protein